jgi:hypothetical protein
MVLAGLGRLVVTTNLQNEKKGFRRLVVTNILQNEATSLGAKSVAA